MINGIHDRSRSDRSVVLKRDLPERAPLFRVLLALCCSAMASFLPFNQQCRNDHEVIGKHGCSDEQLEVIQALGEATLHAPAAEEHGDSAFNSSAEALTTLEGWAFLERGLGRRFLAAPLRNAHEFYPLTGAMTDVGVAEKPTIGTVDLRRSPERFLVALQGRLDVGVVPRVAVEHLILGDQTAGTLGNVDLVTEFDWRQDLAALNQVRVRLEDGKDLLF